MQAKTALKRDNKGTAELFNSLERVLIDNNEKPLKPLRELQLIVKDNGRGFNTDKITKSNVAVDILRPAFQVIDLYEEFLVLLMARSNKVMGVVRIGSGGLHGCIADPKLIFGAALVSGCSGMIVAHNHPSGNTAPSIGDKTLTKRLVSAAKALDVALLDHIILTEESFYSFADEGLM